MGIVVIGATFVDIKGYPLSLYIPSGRNVGRVLTVHGGVSRNIVEDIAKVNLHPTFVSVTDTSPLGQEIIQKLRDCQVDTQYIRSVSDGLGQWLAIFDNSGDVVASISKRPNLNEILNTLKEHGDTIFSQADSIAVELDIDEPIIREIFRLAAKHHKKVYTVVSNISLAIERREYITQTGCFVCNQQEAGIFFSFDYEHLSALEMVEILPEKIHAARIEKMVVTMGSQGAVYAELNGKAGYCPAINAVVKDTTGAGDAFFAGVTIGLTYGKTLGEACLIGTRLANSVIIREESVCPVFSPEEFGISPRT